jgi:two-component system, NarL family, sensor kinase
MVKLCVQLAYWETVVTSPPRRLTLAVAKGHTTGMDEQTAGSRASRTLALLLWSSAMVLALASVALLLLNRAVLHGPDGIGPELVLVPGFATVGAVVASRRRGMGIGWWFLTLALCVAVVEVASQYAVRALITAPGSLPAGVWMAWVDNSLGAVRFGIVGFLLLLFPDGRLPSPRWRPVAWALAVCTGLLTLAMMVDPNPIDLSGVETVSNPLGIEGLRAATAIVALVFFVEMAALLASAMAPILRFRRAAGDERQQLAWLVYVVAVTTVVGIAGVVLVQTGHPLAADVAGIIALVGLGVGIPVAAGIAILRHHLYDLDLVVNRTAVYGGLTACVLATYVAVVGVLGVVFQQRGGLGASLVATGLVAVLFQPLRERLQRAVNRLLYGDRAEPYAAMTRLGQRLETSLAPDAVLPTVVDTVAQALRLPYVAVELRRDEGFEPAAAHGQPSDNVLELPLTYRGETVARLLIGARARGEGFNAADRRLLGDLARQAGVAAHAVRLTADLQRSRERLVSAREEERRRLRRDLHDGLGPTLASIALGLQLARDEHRRDPTAQDALLGRLTAETQRCIAEIRRLAYELRPPALDEFGLVPALREQAAHLNGAADGLVVSMQAPNELPALPAAVEVAAYRITLEALTNVARHAHARRCTVSLMVDGALELVVVDDGLGLSSEHHAGVGLASMRERAAELGGTCSVERLPAGGTRVRAQLPLARA